ncbi:MAG: hypothetical protein M1834_002150 [Cirrosporium novae-zelandiae]|nr:MAG: hypothetical protein M1834_002150 [Cirrosporium novae-zelandiae]
MGILVGTSLIIIIPEGVETLYDASSSTHTHQQKDVIGESLKIRWNSAQARGLVEPGLSIIQRAQDSGDIKLFDEKSDLKKPSELTISTSSISPLSASESTLSTVQHSSTTKSEEKNVDEDEEKEEGEENDKHHEGHSPHVWVGISLISGFVLMYLIDELPRLATSSTKKPHPYHISLNDLGRGFHRAGSPSRDEERNGFLGSGPSRSSRSFSTTMGLVIHSAADGIALGASSSGTSTGLSLIIFLAIMVHKAPAAFGLTSVLLKQGLSKRETRAHLVIFSMAAPLGALVTWVIANALGGGRMGVEGTKWWTGVLLLFSGGTFLYVAMHTMRDESTSPHHHHDSSHANGYADSRESGQEPRRSLQDVLAAVFGMILPLFLQFGHAH